MIVRKAVPVATIKKKPTRKETNQENKLKSNWLFLIPLSTCLLLAACDAPNANVANESPKLQSVAIAKPADLAALEVGLEPGMLAPELTGEDLDGEVFSLSDYKGKVVMLDFWGDW